MRYCLKNESKVEFYDVDDALNGDYSKPAKTQTGELVGTIDLNNGGIVSMIPGREYALVTRHPVVSSQIKSVGYHYATNMMVIEFKNGSVYEYEDVPYDIYETLIESKSLGTYFHKRIRDEFNTIKVEDKK